MNQWSRWGINTGTKYSQRHKANRWCRLNNHSLTPEQIKRTKKYWRQYTNDFNLSFHKKYSSINRSFDVRYIPDDLYYGVIGPRLNNHVLSSMDNKAYYSLLFDCKMPETVIYKINNHYLDRDYKLISVGQAIDLCAESGIVIFKPSVSSSGGKNINFVNCHDQENINTAFKNYATISSFVVQKIVKQHPQIGAIHQASVNTIRIMTLFINDAINVLPPVLRMGINNSSVDNASSGGIVCGIQPDGRLKSCAFSANGIKYDVHPQGFNFEDCVIPSINQAMDMVKRLAERFPDFKLIAWDVAIGEDAEPILIEANFECGQIDFMQFNNGPLFGDLTDDVLNEVYKFRRG